MSNFHPPPRPEPKTAEPKEWYEELLEKDELLLYVTATLGVVLPGIVYLIYQRLHAIYTRYAAKREAERRAEEAAKCEIAVLRMGGTDGAAAQFSSRLKELLKGETTQELKEWSIDTVKASQLMAFRGACVFVIDESGIEGSNWLLEWMEETAADSRAKRKTKFDDIRFVVVGFAERNEKSSEKIVKIICRRMKILGAKQILDVALFNNPIQEEVFSDWYEAFLDEMERSLPGAESSMEEDETTESELEDDEEGSREEHKKTI